MVDDGGGANFSVVFFDGEREINMGRVRIHPSMDFKSFQLKLSQRIGISPNQITVYLVDGKRPKSVADGRKKIPITAKVNFAAIAEEIGCFFLAVLKRSRKNRKSKPKHDVIDFGDYFPGEELRPSPAKMMLLRRNQPQLNNTHFPGYLSSQYNQIAALELADYNETLQNLQFQRENYAMMMNSNANATVNLDMDSFPRIEESLKVSPTIPRGRPFCEECANASKKRIPARFHLCVLDPIAVGLRSTAGPIAPPRKAIL